MSPPHQATVHFIRQIHSKKGTATKEDLIALARLLGGLKEARTRWPGEAVYHVLEEILEDGHVEDYELEGLSKILAGLDMIAEERLRIEEPVGAMN